MGANAAGRGQGWVARAAGPAVAMAVVAVATVVAAVSVAVAAVATWVVAQAVGVDEDVPVLRVTRGRGPKTPAGARRACPT